MCYTSEYARIRTDVFRTLGIWLVVVRSPWDSPIRFSHRFWDADASCPDLQHPAKDVWGCPTPAHTPASNRQGDDMCRYICGFFESTASVCLHPVRWVLGVQIVVPTNIRFWMKIQTYWDSLSRNHPPHQRCRLYLPVKTFRRDALFNHPLHVMTDLLVFATLFKNPVIAEHFTALITIFTTLYMVKSFHDGFYISFLP